MFCKCTALAEMKIRRWQCPVQYTHTLTFFTHWASSSLYVKQLSHFPLPRLVRMNSSSSSNGPHYQQQQQQQQNILRYIHSNCQVTNWVALIVIIINNSTGRESKRKKEAERDRQTDRQRMKTRHGTAKGLVRVCVWQRERGIWKCKMRAVQMTILQLSNNL